MIHEGVGVEGEFFFRFSYPTTGAPLWHTRPDCAFMENRELKLQYF